jgi:hypothetical protein
MLKMGLISTILNFMAAQAARQQQCSACFLFVLDARAAAGRLVAAA